MLTTRRGFLGLGGAGLLGLASLSHPAVEFNLPVTAADPMVAAQDENFWSAVASLYDRPAAVAHLEHGNWGSMARSVLSEYLARTKQVNRDTAFYSRRAFGAEISSIRERVARELGVDAEEIVFTRNATEALHALIGGYHRLGPGDAVLYADLDYDAMQTTMRWLGDRRGVQAIAIDLPEPATRENLIEAYARALEKTPSIKLMLLTHLSHRTGLIPPVRKIVELARAAGVDVIVDSAHAWGQIDFRLPDLGADFVGLNLHKWIGAPVGVGLMYVKRDRLDAIEPYMGERDNGKLSSRIRTGTTNHSAFLAVGAALDLHSHLGPARKEARLRYLRNRWVGAVRDHPAVDILTPDDPALHAAITSFRLHGHTSVAANKDLATTLLDPYGVFTVLRSGLASGTCVRVTPAIHTFPAEVDRLAAAIGEIAGASLA